jgi:tRNA 2-selenouridine synthase
MSERIPKGVATLAQLATFDEVIDARSPSEYAEDHLPDAISCPVLSDEERARIGTMYKQVSPFEAKKAGAALVARNIAGHIEGRFRDRPKAWRPLVYCWRGGKRSGAFTHILREIGWDAHRLEGGYKTWRHQVVADLGTLPGRFRFQVISGATGSAKSRVLEALAAQGAQTLHLEALAAHKGSVLGSLPGQPQPSQKCFESRLHAAMSALNPARPVFVEAESRRIGSLQVPDALIAAIRGAQCLRIEAGRDARVAFLLQDYDYFLTNPVWLRERLGLLRGLQSNETLDTWMQMAEAGHFQALVRALLEQHYDPLYHRSQSRNYQDYASGPVFGVDDLSPTGIETLAAAIRAAMPG